MSFAQFTDRNGLRDIETTLHHGKGGLKMHTLMDLNGSIPTFIRLTEASVHDSKILEEVPVEPNAYYLMDKGYVKFDTLYTHFHHEHAWFVTRAKDNMKYEVLESREIDSQAGLISDETIKLIGYYTSRKYPDNLRLVVYEDFRDGTVYRFLTNNFTLEAITIAELYRERWQILFKRGDIRDFYNKPEVPLDVPEEGSARQLTLW